MSTINEELTKILTSVYGRDVRQAIHDAIQIAYDDATVSGNANLEVSKARGIFTTLEARLNNLDLTDQDKLTVLKNVQDQVNNLVLNAAGDGSNPESAQARGAHWVLNDRENEQEDYVLKANKNLYGDIKGGVQRGYYGRYDGVRQIGKDGANGTNWYNFYIVDSTNKTFLLEYPTPISVRMVEFTADGTYISSKIISNGSYTVSATCGQHAINLQLANSLPDVTDLTEFSNIRQFRDIVISASNIGIVKKLDQLDAQVDLISENLGLENTGSGTDVMKILTIGNSFSEDMVEYVSAMAERVGLSIVIGQMFIANASLENHWNNANTNANAYVFDKWVSGAKTVTNNVSIATAVANEDWDYITFQQTSAYSGDYRTFQPYLNDLIAYVRARKTNPSMDVGLHMTWAYATNSTHVGFANYGNNQMTMYNGIVNAYQQAMREANLGFLIPSGTAIQNARTNSHLKSAGNELTRDGYHLDLGTGRFIAGLTLFEVLLARKFKKDIDADMTYAPAAKGVTFFHAMLSKTAVKNAALNPFRITEI